MEKEFGEICDDVRLKNFIIKRCETELDINKACAQLLEEFVRSFNENSLDRCYDILISMRNTAGFEGYRLAAGDIYNLLSK